MARGVVLPGDFALGHVDGVNVGAVLRYLDVVIGTEEEFFALLAEDPGPVMQGQTLAAAQLSSSASCFALTWLF